MKNEAKQLLDKIFSTPNEKKGDQLVIQFCQQRSEQGYDFITPNELLEYIDSHLEALAQCPPLFFSAILRYVLHDERIALMEKLQELANQGNIGVLTLYAIQKSRRTETIISEETLEELMTSTLTPAAKNDSMAAQYALSILVDKSKQPPPEQLATLEKLANENYPPAQYSLAILYQETQGVTQRVETATELLQKAANQGDVEVQLNLALLCASGQGVTQNFETAAKFFEKAANQGDIDAQLELGSMYEKGKNITQNLEKAAKLYQRATEQGVIDGALSLISLHLNLNLNTPKAADQGILDLQFNLADLYLNLNSQDAIKNLKEASKYAALAYLNEGSFSRFFKRKALEFLALLYIKSGILTSEANMTPLELLTTFKEKSPANSLASTIIRNNESLTALHPLARPLRIHTAYTKNTRIAHLLNTEEELNGNNDFTLNNQRDFYWGIHPSTPMATIEKIHGHNPLADYFVYPGVKIDKLAKILGPIGFKKVLGINPLVQQAIDFYRWAKINEFEARIQTAQVALAHVSSELPQEVIDQILKKAEPALATCFSSEFWRREIENTRNGRLAQLETQVVEQNKMNKLLLQRIDRLEKTVAKLTPQVTIKLSANQTTLDRFFKPKDKKSEKDPKPSKKGLDKLS